MCTKQPSIPSTDQKKRGKISQIYISIYILFINTRAFAVSKQRHKRYEAVRMDAPPCGVVQWMEWGDMVVHMGVEPEMLLLPAEAPQVKCNIGAGK